MSVSVGFTEFAIPHACVRYTCSCGAAAVEHGRHADLPEGWVEVEPGTEAATLLCPGCAERGGVPPTRERISE